MTTRLRILADENIPYVREAFAPLGSVKTLSGRAMTAAAAREADLLLVRSITTVDRAFLEGSPVRFVATATIGEDHVDKAYLAERGIAFSSAPGSNADSVRQYVTAALLALAERFELDLSSLALGIIGVGHVGSRVWRNAVALGLRCVLNDPPQARTTGDPRYRPLDEIFACDLVTLHTPLTREGPDATFHLADESFIRRLKRGAILINTSRGAVADGEAIKRALDDGHLRACVLDVWEGEPRVDVDLLERAAIGTPHISGYSFDGKVNGTRQIYEAACRFLGIAPTWNPAPLLPAPECPSVVADGASVHELGPDPIACIPLKVGDEVLGVIAIYTLLRQKPGFRAVDLLAGKIEIRNKYHFLNLNILRGHWTLFENGVQLETGELARLDVPPGHTTDVVIPFKQPELRAGAEYRLGLSFKLAEETPWAQDFR